MMAQDSSQFIGFIADTGIMADCNPVFIANALQPVFIRAVRSKQVTVDPDIQSGVTE